MAYSPHSQSPAPSLPLSPLQAAVSGLGLGVMAAFLAVFLHPAIALGVAVIGGGAAVFWLWRKSKRQHAAAVAAYEEEEQAKAAARDAAARKLAEEVKSYQASLAYMVAISGRLIKETDAALHRNNSTAEKRRQRWRDTAAAMLHDFEREYSAFAVHLAAEQGIYKSEEVLRVFATAYPHLAISTDWRMGCLRENAAQDGRIAAILAYLPPPTAENTRPL